SSHSSRTSYAIAADLSEMELKKILIENIEGNKSIQHSDEQRNLYKALVEAYEADKDILDTYGDSTILKRRREDDDQEGPSAGPNRGSKRQKKEVSKHQLALPLKKQPRVQADLQQGLNLDKGGDDQLIVQTSQHPEWFSQPRRPPSPDRAWNTALIIAVTELQIMEWHDYKHLDCISVRHDDDQIYKFKEGDFKRLRLQDIEDMLLLLEHCHQEAHGKPSTGSGKLPEEA
nr:hypothetical protein [Tanacetum cinerariifolium]